MVSEALLGVEAVMSLKVKKKKKKVHWHNFKLDSTTEAGLNRYFSPLGVEHDKNMFVFMLKEQLEQESRVTTGGVDLLPASEHWRLHPTHP